MVLAGHSTREAPGQTVHAIFQQVPHPTTHTSPRLTLLLAHSSTAMLPSKCNGYFCIELLFGSLGHTEESDSLQTWTLI